MSKKETDPTNDYAMIVFSVIIIAVVSFIGWLFDSFIFSMLLGLFFLAFAASVIYKK